MKLSEQFRARWAGCGALALLVAMCVPSPGEEPAATTEDAKPAPTASDVAGWIKELDADEYLVRERASRQLIAAGEAGLDALLETANSERLEPSDRAVWILRKLGRSPDSRVAVASLERVVQLRNRPQLVEKAESELAARAVAACQEKLAPLGGEVAVRDEQIVLHGNNVTIAPVVYVHLTEKWQGKTEDLRCLAELRTQGFFRLEGAAVNDAIVALFEDKERLTFLHLLNSKVSLSAVDSLKKRHPKSIVYMRNQALMGVSAENNAAGVMVLTVQRDTGAAAAGIVPGDIIVNLDGKPLPDFDRLTARIAQHQPGDKVEVEIKRGEERSKLTVTLGSWAEVGQ